METGSFLQFSINNTKTCIRKSKNNQVQKTEQILMIALKEFATFINSI